MIAKGHAKHIGAACAAGAIFVLAGCSTSNTDLGRRVLNAWTQEGALSEQTIVDGLKEALAVGTQRAVAQVSQPGGYGDQPALRIPTPDELDSLVSALRNVGLGGQVDRFENEMNRAAEKAAAEAVPVFANAIREMTFQDARDILQGGNTAATDYFRSSTSDVLAARYEPVIASHMERLGVIQMYNSLLDRYRKIPLAPEVNVDVESYVADRAVDGLFSVLAKEEQKIRKNPAARTTELLQRVFGR